MELLASQKELQLAGDVQGNQNRKGQRPALSRIPFVAQDELITHSG